MLGRLALAAIVLTAAVVPQEDVLHDQVETIEVNHFYDDGGQHVFDQWIFRGADHEIVDWRLRREDTPIDLGPRSHVLRWVDSGVLRRVEARAALHTWTQWDPEVCERAVLPKEERTGLCEPVRKREPVSVLVAP
jgi:hypothetical protein